MSQRTSPRSSVCNQLTSMTVDSAGRGYRSSMGFNPFRDHEKSTADIVAVVVAFVAIFAVLAWAIFSG